MITGASSGIGKATALGLAKMGATVVMVCRDRGRGEAAMDEIRAENDNQAIDLMLADLSSQASIRQLVSDFKDRYQQLQVLVNNAGVFLSKRSVTEDGIETHFAVNYLAPYLLTNLLLDVLKAGAPARIVNVSGTYHRKATMDFDDLMCEKGYSGSRANNQAKLALILFTYDSLVEKDPDYSPLSRFLYKLSKPFLSSPEKGAETSIYLASSPEVEGVTGKYFEKKAAVESSPESYDVAIAKRLWEVSAELTGLSP
jgi:hypothetical protein